MGLKITFDMFSGRPNPVVEVTGIEERELRSRLTAPTRGKAAKVPPLPPPVLGYRGLLIEQTGDTVDRKLPRAFRIAAGHLYDRARGRPLSDPRLEDFICGSTGPIRLTRLGATGSERALVELERYRVLVKKMHRPHRPRPGKHRCKCAPLWEPGWWNDAGQVQFNNNCYNYATDYRSDTFAQPGLAAGAMYASLTCPDVRSGAIADKLLGAPRANKCPKEGHLVALVVGPGWDFHWYRKGRNGYWTHKPGGTEATDVDNSMNPIADPRTADRGGYTDFCSFMVVMHGHIKIA